MARGVALIAVVVLTLGAGRSRAQLGPRGVDAKRTGTPTSLVGETRPATWSEASGGSTHFVIGGRPVQAEYPAVGALIWKDSGEAPAFICTGTLIGPRLVLTAAHCIDPWTSERLSFTLSTDPLQPGREHAVAELYIHPDYRASGASSIAHDIGLVELVAPLEEVVPEQLADGSSLQVGASVELVGYGSMRLPPSSERVKNAGRASVAALGERELTIGAEHGVENCVGDSGGPSLAVDAAGQRRIVGVVSRALNPATPCQGGSIHTRVDAYRDFVAEVRAISAQRPVGGGTCAMRPPCERSPGIALSLALGAWSCLLARLTRRGRELRAHPPALA